MCNFEAARIKNRGKNLPADEYLTYRLVLVAFGVICISDFARPILLFPERNFIALCFRHFDGEQWSTFVICYFLKGVDRSLDTVRAGGWRAGWVIYFKYKTIFGGL